MIRMKHFSFIFPSDNYWCRLGITGVVKNISFTLGILTRQWWDGFFYHIDSGDDANEKWHTLSFGIGYLSWVNHDKENEDVKEITTNT